MSTEAPYKSNLSRENGIRDCANERKCMLAHVRFRDGKYHFVTTERPHAALAFACARAEERGGGGGGKESAPRGERRR